MGKKDITQKSFFEDAEIFADLMNAVYFGGDEILEAKDLLPENTSLQLEDERLMEQLKEQRRRKEEIKNERNNREEENVCKAIDDMIEKGVKRGKVEGKIESVFELLSDLGEISNSLREKISAETDEAVLSRWLKLAVKCEKIAEFESTM